MITVVLSVFFGLFIFAITLMLLLYSQAFQKQISRQFKSAQSGSSILQSLFPRIYYFVKIIFDTSLVLTIRPIQILSFYDRYSIIIQLIISVFSILFLIISSQEKYCLIFIYSLLILAIIKQTTDSYLSALFSSFSLTLIPLIFQYVVIWNNKVSTQFSEQVKVLNIMAQNIKNLFINSVPNRILPLILENEQVISEKLLDVAIISVQIKSIQNQTSHQYIIDHLSEINQFYSIIDFISQVIGVNKIKSDTISYFSFVDINIKDQQCAQFQVASTYALTIIQVANFLNIQISISIVRGDIYLGVVQLDNDYIGIDSYGKSIQLGYNLTQQMDDMDGIFIAIDTFKQLNYHKRQNILNKQSQFHENEMQQLCSSYNFSWANSEIVQSEPVYQFSKKKILQIGLQEFNIVQISSTKQFYHLFESIFERAITHFISDDALVLQQAQNILNDSQKQDSSKYIKNTILNASEQLSNALMVSAQENKISFNNNFDKIVTSFTKNQDNIDINYQFKYSLIDALVNSDNDDDTEKLQSLENFTTENIETNTISTSALSQYQQTCQVVDENLLKPQLANFLCLAQNTQSTKSSKNNSLANKSAFNKLKVQILEDDNSDLTNATESFVDEDNQLGNSQEFIAAIQHIKHSDTNRSNRDLQTLHDENKEFEELLYFDMKSSLKSFNFMKHLIRQYRLLQLVSIYSVNQLKLHPQFYCLLVSRQTKYNFSIETQLLLFAFLYYLISNIFYPLPTIKVEYFGFLVQYRTAYFSISIIQVIASSINFIFINQFNTLQDKFQKEQTKLNLNILIQFNTKVLRQFERIYRSLFYFLNNFLLGLILRAINQYQQNIELQKFGFIIIIQFVFQLIFSFSIIIASLLDHSTPLQFLQINFKIFFQQYTVILFYISIEYLELLPIFVFLWLFTVVCTISSIKSHFINSALNLKIGDQIKTGRKLLKTTQPLIATDSMLTVKNQEGYPNLVKQFPFLRKFSDSIYFLNEYTENELIPSTVLNQLFVQFLKHDHKRNLSLIRPIIYFKNITPFYYYYYYYSIIIILLKFSIVELSQQDIKTIDLTMQFTNTLYQSFFEKLQQTSQMHMISANSDGYLSMAYPALIKQYAKQNDFLFEQKRILSFDSVKELLMAYDSLVITIATAIGFLKEFKLQLENLNNQLNFNAVCSISFGDCYGTMLGNYLAKYDLTGQAYTELCLLDKQGQFDTIQLSSSAYELLLAGETEFKKYINKLETQESVGGISGNYQDELVSFIVNKDLQVQSLE